MIVPRTTPPTLKVYLPLATPWMSISSFLPQVARVRSCRLPVAPAMARHFTSETKVSESVQPLGGAGVEGPGAGAGAGGGGGGGGGGQAVGARRETEGIDRAVVAVDFAGRVEVEQYLSRHGCVVEFDRAVAEDVGGDRAPDRATDPHDVALAWRRVLDLDTEIPPAVLPRAEAPGSRGGGQVAGGYQGDETFGGGAGGGGWRRWRTACRVDPKS